MRVGVARTESGYGSAPPPYLPETVPPELSGLRVGAGARPNHGFEGVRAALLATGLDAARQGRPDWNPLGGLAPRGGVVVLKPNFIRHWNPLSAEGGGSVESVITHGSIVRAAADYAALAVGPDGRVVVAEAPQQDCDFDRIREIAGLDAIVADFRARGLTLELIDLRRECVRFEDGVITERRPLPGDPAGYREVDLGRASFFEGSGLDPARFRGADYDPGPTVTHHQDGRNAYLLSETVLSADLIVNLPKLKTHKKTGVTLALKNLVGINGDKNWLPHHTIGAVGEGGDEYPERSLLDAARSHAVELARPWLHRGRGLAWFRAARRAENAVRGTDFVRSGNWHGNQTTWRMCCDLNRCVAYSDRKGLHLDAPAPVRRILTVIDGIVAGEGEGPLAPADVPLGVVVASEDPVAADLAAIRLMGFDEQRIPKVWEAIQDEGPRITGVRSAAEVVVGDSRGAALGLDDLHPPVRGLRPHPAWLGAIERE